MSQSNHAIFFTFDGTALIARLRSRSFCHRTAPPEICISLSASFCPSSNSSSNESSTVTNGISSPVGRLDYDSEGLIILTDDGDLAMKLTHPRHDVEKERLDPSWEVALALYFAQNGLNLHRFRADSAAFSRALGRWLRDSGHTDLEIYRRLVAEVGLD